MTKLLDGKTAVISGAASGIGSVIAKRLAGEGASVVLGDVDTEWGMAREEEIGAAGNSATFVKTDVSRGEDVARLFQTAVDNYGGVDISVHSAGVGVHKLVVDLEEEDWDYQVDVQLRGAFLMARAAGRIMIDQGRGGRIVNIGSTSSAVARFHSGPHSASKAGIIMLTRVLALELGPHGITANVVAPGLTDIRDISHHGSSTDDYIANFVREVPIGRLGRPEEIAEAVMYMCSDGAAFTTGQIIYIDGGYSSGKIGVQGTHTRSVTPKPEGQ